MRHSHRHLALIASITAAVFLSTGCGWQMFENVQVKANPTYQVPGGTGRQLIADLEIFEQIENDLSGAFDETSRFGTNPYTFRGSITPISVSVDDFLDETGINQTAMIDDVAFGGVDVGAIGIPGVSQTIGVVEEDTSAQVSESVTVGPIDGFVSGIIGDGSLDVTIGSDTDPLPNGTYSLTVTVGGAGTSSVTDSIFDETNPGTLSLQVDLSDGGISPLQIENGQPVEISIELSWTDVQSDTQNIPVTADFSINEFSELVLDVGQIDIPALALDPIEIEEEIRRLVESFRFESEDEIELIVTADIPADIEVTLNSGDLFAGGSESAKVNSSESGPQTLPFPVVETIIVLDDPDVPGTDVTEIDISIEIVFDDSDENFNGTDNHLTFRNVRTDAADLGTLTDIEAAVDLGVAEVTLRDIGTFLNDFDTPSFGEDELGFLDELPEWFRFSMVPIRLGILGELPPESNTPAVTVSVKPFAEVGDTEPIEGETVAIDEIVFGEGLKGEDIAGILNLDPPPARIDIEVKATGGDGSLTLSSGDSLEVVIEIDLIFAFAVDTGGMGDPANLLAEFLDEDAFAVEGDLLDRESADDLEEIFTNLESARLYLNIENTSGLDGLSFSIIQPGADGWTLAEGNLDGDLLIELTRDDVRQIQTTYPFEPEVRLFVAEGQYDLNYDGEIAVGLRLELTADIDYTFTVFGEDQ